MAMMSWRLCLLGLFFPFYSHSQQLTQITYPFVPTATTIDSLNAYGGDVFVVGNDYLLQTYYQTYLFSNSPTTYSLGSPLVISSLAPLTSSAAGQSLNTFDVLVGGIPLGNSGTGMAIIWKDTRIDWSQQQILIARDALAGDLFGQAVAMDMNNAHISLIGAPGSDDKGLESGSAYIFQSSPTAKFWTQGQQLTGSTEYAGCNFGSEVQIQGRQAAVTAPGCCKLFLFEQEKPKPTPPPPIKCGSDDDNVTSSDFKSRFKDEGLKSLFVHPYSDIVQTKTLQWSEQQVLDFGDWCTSNSGYGLPTTQGMTMSMNNGNLILGFPYYDNLPGVDTGLVLSLSMETFRGDCNSNIFPKMLSFQEIVDLKERTFRLWEVQNTEDIDSRCTHPPKPTPQCEVTRWSTQQVLTVPDSSCSYYGSNVATCGDLLYVQASNYDVSDSANCNPLLQYNPNYMDGTIFVYEKQSNGQWSILQIIPGDTNANSNFGSPLTCDGAKMYAGSTLNANSADTGSIVPSTASTTQYSQDTTWDCAVIMLGDQFGDGWNGADLVISGPGPDQQRYTDSCDSVSNPYYVRWCPTDNTQCGEVTMEIPRATDFPFYPEISWGVQLENSGAWVYGDYGTKLTFNWDCVNHELTLVQGTDVVEKTPSCDCDCQTTRPTLKPTPQHKPIEKSNPTISPTSFPTLSPTSTSNPEMKSSENLIERTHEGDISPNSRNRLLKGGDDNTHRPTISPAPTLIQLPYDHWEWLSMSSTTYCSSTNAGVHYYIYDKSGTHLLQTGTLCSTSLKCWMILPPNQDYILRTDGALDTSGGTFTADFCGYSLASQSHFEFSISADQQCTAEEFYTRSTYCTSELKVKALISGVLLMSGLHLTTLSIADQSIIQSAFDSLFGNVGVTSVLTSQDSTDGLLVSFTIGVPITYYGLTNTEYNGPHIAYLKAHDDLIYSFRSELFTSMLDSHLHSYLYLQTNDLSNQFGTCHLKSHGPISLLSVLESGWENAVPNQDIIEPITFLPEISPNNFSSGSFLQSGPTTFLIVVMFGVIFIYLIQKYKKPNSPEKIISSPPSPLTVSSSQTYFKKHFKYIYDFAHRSPADKRQKDYRVIASAQSDDVENSLYQPRIKKQEVQKRSSARHFGSKERVVASDSSDSDEDDSPISFGAYRKKPLNPPKRPSRKEKHESDEDETVEFDIDSFVDVFQNR